MKCFAGLLLVLFVSLAFAEDSPPIDWSRARELKHKADAGQTLTPEERAYLHRAMQERQSPRLIFRAGQPIGVKPLTELGADEKYKGEDGGLYGAGHNEHPTRCSSRETRRCANPAARRRRSASERPARLF